MVLRLALGLVALLTLSPSAAVPARAAGVVPTQWVAKMYTEALGRAPSAGEWSFWMAYYSSNACGVSTLSTLGTAIYTGADFLAAYSPEASSRPQRVIALVRGVYSHDPNANDWSAYYTLYADGTLTWTQVVSAIFNNGVFGALVVPAVCGASPDYGFGYSRPLDVLAGGSRTLATLQGQLNAAQASCGIVALRPTELIRAGTQALTVPACVTLTTAGGPGPSSYASMGRIVPDGLTCQVFWCSHTAIVSLGRGATLRGVWVDGAGADSGQVQLANVETQDTAGADGTTVTGNRLTDPGPNGTAVRLDGFGTTGVPCSGVTVSGNLVTGYAGHRSQDAMGQARWASGITDLCEGATITGNQLVDLTDRGITIEGVRYRVPSPLLPLTATAAGTGTGLGQGDFSLTYTYNYNSPLTVQSGVAPTTGVTTTAAGQRIDVAAITGIPAGVASLSFYIAVPFVVPFSRTATVAVSGGGTPAFSITALPATTVGPPTWDQISIPAVQRSQVSGNTIVSAGNSAFAALAADPIGECAAPYASASVPQSLVPTTCLDLPDKRLVDGSPPTTAPDPRDFTGSSVTGNAFWTGPRTDLFVGLLVGSWSVWGSSGPLGAGASFTNNTVPITPTRVNMAIDTDGMLNARLAGNTTAPSAYALVDGNPGILDNKCPRQVWGYNPFTASFVAGSDVPPVTSAAWLDCVMPSPAPMDRIAVGTGTASLTLVGATTGIRFSPFGTNYAAGNEVPPGTGGGILARSHDMLVRDFRTIRHAGFNMIRTFLEFSDFVDPPSPGHPDGTPRAASLALLQDAVDLAARDGLYVDVTGLFESDPAHMPAWYDALTADGGEAHGRWQAQQAFWAAVADQLKDDANVLDYDLMNEPFVSNAGSSGPWNVGCIGSPATCYTQAITKNLNGRAAADIVRAWIGALTAAIRGTGDTHLVTVGELSISTGSGFDAKVTAPLLDYVSVHDYPRSGTAGITAALALVKNFQQGKPLVLEEWYPLNNADGNEMSGFIASTAQPANGSVTGWVGQWNGCGLLQLNDPPGSCGGDTFGLGAVFAKTVITVTLQSRLPRAFPEV